MDVQNIDGIGMAKKLSLSSAVAIYPVALGKSVVQLFLEISVLTVLL